MHVTSCAFTIVESIRISKSCLFFPSYSFFAEAEERSGVSSLLSRCSSIIRTKNENLPRNPPLIQLKITIINDAAYYYVF